MAQINDEKLLATSLSILAINANEKPPLSHGGKRQSFNAHSDGRVLVVSSGEVGVLIPVLWVVTLLFVHGVDEAVVARLGLVEVHIVHPDDGQNDRRKDAEDQHDAVGQVDGDAADRDHDERYPCKRPAF